MKMDTYTLPDVLMAHRQAVALHRQQYPKLSRNAIEVMLYASNQERITATEIADNFLLCNLYQAKRVLTSLVAQGILWSHGQGVKGKPLYYFLTDTGRKQSVGYFTAYGNKMREIQSKRS